MTRKTPLVLAAALMAAGCGGAQFSVPQAPRLNSIVLEAPRPPEAKPVAARLTFGELEEEATAAASAGIAPDGRIAILPVRRAGAVQSEARVQSAMTALGAVTAPSDPKAVGREAGPVLPPDATMLVEGLLRAGFAVDPAGSDPVARMVEDRLMAGLLKVGVTRFLGPDELGAIGARKVATRDGQITWQGSLDQLARVEPVTDAELLVSVRIDRAEQAEIVAPVHWQFDPASFGAYRDAFRRFVDAAKIGEAEARNAATSHRSRCDKEKRRYESDGGKFTGGGPEPTSGDKGLAECNAEVARFEAQASRLERLRGSPPHPDELMQSAERKKEEKSQPVFDFAAQVRLIAARDLRLLWMGELRVRSATTDEAIERTTARINDEIVRLRQAGAAAPPAPAGWNRK